jgi:hypothetical protein
MEHTAIIKKTKTGSQETHNEVIRDDYEGKYISIDEAKKRLIEEIRNYKFKE